MKQIKIMVYSKRKIKRNLLIILVSSIGIYLLMTLYFYNHFFFNTEINGINVSLRAHKELASIISDYINKYELLLIERNGAREIITSHDIEMGYNKTNSLPPLNSMKNPFMWINSLFNSRRYYIKDLFDYNHALLNNKINSLKCLNRKTRQGDVSAVLFFGSKTRQRKRPPVLPPVLLFIVLYI